jgi:predicted anti-sigma-YlaC factor YlaD
MNCSEAQELFGIYFDLHPDDSRRVRADVHIRSCEACAEEFRLWEESRDLIRFVQEDKTAVPEPARISGSVMDRIYRDESWRIPVSEKMYAIPYKLRRNLIAVIAFCLALFAVSFVYTLLGHPGAAKMAEHSPHIGSVISPINISAEDKTAAPDLGPTAVASVGNTMFAPVKLGTINKSPDYWLVLSLVGLTSALLIMNWLSRTRT